MGKRERILHANEVKFKSAIIRKSNKANAMRYALKCSINNMYYLFLGRLVLSSSSSKFHNLICIARLFGVCVELTLSLSLSQNATTTTIIIADGLVLLLCIFFLSFSRACFAAFRFCFVCLVLFISYYSLCAQQ